MMSRFCIFFILIIGRLQGGDLFSIILCDTEAGNISDSIVLDLKYMRNEVARIQSYTQMRLIETIFEGDALYPNEIYNFLEGMAFNPDDVVIFYFSGHGYRTPSKGSNPWPNLYFSVAEQGMDFFDVTELLRAKNPRLLLSMCDCCNNSIPDNAAPDVYEKEWMSESMDSQIRENYKKLFMDTSGLIMVRSSDVGEYSWCNAKGALYTLAFLESLKSYIRNSKNVTWEAILSDASLRVLKHQTPIYELAIDRQ